MHIKSIKMGRLALGLAAIVAIVSVACGGYPGPAGVEPKASHQEIQQRSAASASDPEVNTKPAAAAVTAISKEITPISNPNEPVAAPDASVEVPSPAPALTSVAKDGTTQMEKNPVFEAAIPSVAGPTVIEASLPVTQSAGTLGDLTDILESEIQVVDITSNSARVIAQTTVDVACAVAFGKTTDYGSLAVDSDMGGAGHADHGPQLTGLEPDTIYHLTFGGIGPDGTVYGYKDLTFRTKPADAGPEQNTRGENLALAVNGGRVSSVSSNYGSPSMDSSFGANNVLDGKSSTQWSSQGDGNGAWIEIELAQDSHVTSLGFWTRTMGTSAQIASFRVITDRGEVFGPFGLADASSVHYFDVELTAKKLRFETVDSSGGNTGVVEIAVYGEPAP